jgi:hypothetical protein
MRVGSQKVMLSSFRWPRAYWRLDEPDADSLFLPPRHLAAEALSTLGNEGEVIWATARVQEYNASAIERPIDHDAVELIIPATEGDLGGNVHQ